MKADICIKQLYYNPSCWDFFFREQSQEMFKKICYAAYNVDEMLLYVDESDKFCDIDDFEEYLHDYTFDEIIDYIGKEFFDIEEENEEEL